MTERNKCVLISEKEYEELKRKAQCNHISIEWGYSIFTTGNYFHSEGTMDLSSGLLKKVKSICSHINDTFHKEIADFYNYTEIRDKTIENGVISKFIKLPWYKRLFFKKSYIQK